MKRFKIPALVLGFFFAISAVLAFNQKETKTQVGSKHQFDSYFKLINNGNKMTRNHWVIDDYDPSCPEEVTANPCRIKALADGSNPDSDAFDDILDVTDGFTEEYPDIVTYKP